jgi:DNA integrity scanning protein DisA with diadenylate cyclase activity
MQSWEGLRPADVVDVLLVAALLWLGIAGLRTSRARLALLGLAAVGALFGVARAFELQLTTLLLQGFFAVTAVMLVVVFQDDLRRLFEGIALRVLRRAAPVLPEDAERVLVRIAFRLAAARIGGLFVLPGREPLERHLDGGIYLDGRVSEPLLESLLDPRTAGHDGAVVIRANNISRFGVHLPLSTDWDQLGGGGTRHAAALGLAERSDALSLVVSEERGEVSIACDGRLERIETADALARRLHDFIARTTKNDLPSGPAEFVARVRGRWREGLAALALAFGLWALAVPGSTVEVFERRVPIVVENLPEGYSVDAVDPSEVVVRFEGQRRDRYLAGGAEVSVHLDALLLKLGRRTFGLSLDQVHAPDRLRAVAVAPSTVKLSVQGP